MARPLPLDELPGGDLVQQGLADLGRGVESTASLLVEIGAPRLRQLDLDAPLHDPERPLPEHRLYALLAGLHGDAAHARYNALLRQLVSFTRAASCVS